MWIAEVEWTTREKKSACFAMQDPQNVQHSA